MQEENPKEVCASGSVVKLESVHLAQEFDNPQAIEALGTIKCDGRKWAFRYVWGLGKEIHYAPFGRGALVPLVVYGGRY